MIYPPSLKQQSVNETWQTAGDAAHIESCWSLSSYMYKKLVSHSKHTNVAHTYSTTHNCCYYYYHYYYSTITSNECSTISHHSCPTLNHSIRRHLPPLSVHSLTHTLAINKTGVINGDQVMSAVEE